MSCGGTSEGRRDVQDGDGEAGSRVGLLVWNGLVARAEQAGSAFVTRSEPVVQADGEERRSRELERLSPRLTAFRASAVIVGLPPPRRPRARSAEGEERRKSDHDGGSP